ncbi:hypothetical protein DPMN_026319 [Dreissena polymorpha]|uniref:Uncharacterized protein n=1 Tax=Dreissena polymorpha TaxID=45954 RepID=A0A9D4LSZ8_DREPO|nr:hypothetical protein DPMN_026319 [Dreissena polymorpha]
MENVTFLYEYFNDNLAIRLRNDSSGIYSDVDKNMTQIEYELLKQPSYMIVLYDLMYGLVFVFGLLGNTFVIAVIYKEPSAHLPAFSYTIL